MCEVGREGKGALCCAWGVYLSVPEDGAEIHYARALARTRTYSILGQLSYVGVIALEENPSLSSCLEFLLPSERSWQSEGAQIKIPKGISTGSASLRRTLRG